MSFLLTKVAKKIIKLGQWINSKRRAATPLGNGPFLRFMPILKFIHILRPLLFSLYPYLGQGGR